MEDESVHKEKGPVVIKMAHLTKIVSNWLSISRIDATLLLQKSGIQRNTPTGFFQFVGLLKVLHSKFADDKDYDSFVIDLLEF